MARPVRPIEERRLLGIGLVLVSYLLFTVIDSCAKWLSTAGLPTPEIVFIRYAGQLLLVSALFLPTRSSEVLRTRSWRLEILRGLCLLGSTVFNFFAITFLPLTVTASIFFTTPLILCALSIPFLAERVGWRRWLAIATGFVGVLIIVRPGTASFHPAVLLSLCAAALSAFYLILTRKLAGVDSTTTQQFYAALVATLCIAHRFAPASVLAPFGYFQIIFMTASSWLIFNQPPDIWIYVGVPIVVCSGLYIWLRERQLHKEVVTGVTVQD